MDSGSSYKIRFSDLDGYSHIGSNDADLQQLLDYFSRGKLEAPLSFGKSTKYLHNFEIKQISNGYLAR